MSTQDPLSPSLDRPLPNSYWVIPGSLLAGEHPAGPDEAETSARLAALRQAGIDCFIDLTEAGEQPEYSHLLRPQDDEYLRFEIPDMGVPYQVSRTMDLLLGLRMALGRGRGIYRALPGRYRSHRGHHRLLSGRGGAERQIRGQTTEPAVEAERPLGTMAARCRKPPSKPTTFGVGRMRSAQP